MLTAKQEKFVQSIVLDEMNLSDAYRSAYNTDRMTDKTVNEKASLLAGEDKIRARIFQLRQEMITPKIMSAQQRLEWLTRLIQSKEETTSDKLKAADIMNKMQGEYVQKVEADVKQEFTINVELVDE